MPPPALADQTDGMMSVVIPVYRNVDSLPALLERFERVAASIPALELVFVVDGSPDDSYAVLAELLPTYAFRAQLLAHARNFGSFAAIRTGMEAASGRYCSVVAADMQEPPELVTQFHEALASGEYDVAVGVRTGRSDAARHRIPSNVFWAIYRRFVQRDIPRGGVDVFACTSDFRDQLVRLNESNTSLVGLVYWLGFRRAEVPYARLAREHGTSGWTFVKKVRYLTDSVFAFTDLPIRLLSLIGGGGVVISIFVAVFMLVARWLDVISVPGYAGTMLAIAFFGALNLLAIGVLGAYMWRTFENTKGRPGAVVMRRQVFGSVAGDASVADRS